MGAPYVEPRFLSRDDVAEFLDPEACVAVTREAYYDRGVGGDAAPRTSLRRNEPTGKLDSYFALLPAEGIMGGYVYAAGFTSGGPWFIAHLFDANTGEPLAMIDGACMNPLKTAAAGAVGIDALAREDSSTLAIFGSGGQASAQLKCAAVVRDFERVQVYSPTKENREKFAADFNSKLEAEVVAVESSQSALSGADVVITATRAADPVFDGENLEPGTHVTAMGQYSPYERELDVITIARSKYVPDLRKRAFRDAGSFLAALDSGAISDSHIHAELGEIVAGKIAGRDSEDQITVFDSGGTGIETIAVANMLYEKAIEADSGTPLRLHTFE